MTGRAAASIKHSSTLSVDEDVFQKSARPTLIHRHHRTSRARSVGAVVLLCFLSCLYVPAGA
eukprot:3546263-Pleurochrysis_carterae.AAC.1